MTLKSKILNFLLPETCRLCKTITHSKLLCQNCEDKIKWITGPQCTHCGTPFQSSSSIDHPCPDCQKTKSRFDWHRSCTYYQKPINQLIYRIKYGGRESLTLAPLFADWILKNHADALTKADYLIPIPITQKKLKTRYHNQANLIAVELSQKTGIPMVSQGLTKVKETLNQTELPRKFRQKNLKNAFQWQHPKINLKNKTILLIDDIYTTGSTLNECSRTLKRLKPKEIGSVTVAHNVMQ